MIACKICVDNKRKWKKMNKHSLRLHYINASKKELLHHNVAHLQPSQLALGYHYYQLDERGELFFYHEQQTRAANCCPECKTRSNKSNVFKWSSCVHKYCANYCYKCVGALVNKFLSIYNDVPRCCYPECNKPLRVTAADAYLLKRRIVLPRYKTPSLNVFNKHQLIFNGYMRINIIDKIDTINIPQEIILLIFDFYKLFFFAKVDCFKCSSVGSVPIDCHLSIGGKQQKKCLKCKGKGKQRKNKKCSGCKGRGIKEEKCSLCDENNEIWSRCLTCNGEKYFIVLDFTKLCNKQLLCNQCNEYFPMKYIVYWSSCYHVFCVYCFARRIKNEIRMHTVPLCSFSNCSKYLTIEDFDLFINAFIITSKKDNTLTWSLRRDEQQIIETNTAKMITMGYNKQTIRVALMLSKGSLTNAIALITQHKIDTFTHKTLKAVEKITREKRLQRRKRY